MLVAPPSASGFGPSHGRDLSRSSPKAPAGTKQDPIQPTRINPEVTTDDLAGLLTQVVPNQQPPIPLVAQLPQQAMHLVGLLLANRLVERIAGRRRRRLAHHAILQLDVARSLPAIHDEQVASCCAHERRQLVRCA